jgi:hypothetical protein
MNGPAGVSDFDPDRFIDREVEAKRFEVLLGLATPHRILAVSDDSGWGKSAFLKKLKFLCDFDHRIPAALIPLEELDDCPDELELVSDVVDQLTEAGVPFPSFHKLNRQRSFHDSGIFVDSLRGIVNASNASISGGQVAGTIFNIERYDSVGAPDWTDEANRQAKQLCLEAFLTELFTAAQQRKIVIIFDNVGSVARQPQRWVLKTLVTDRIVAERVAGHKLIIVMAGEKLERQLRSLFSDLACFDLIPVLGVLRPEHIDQLFEAHNLEGLPSDYLALLRHGILAREVSLAGALTLADVYCKVRLKPK